MSIIAGLQKFPLDAFGGGNQRGERTDVRPEWSIEARNTQFEPGFIFSRRGFYSHASAIFQETLAVVGVYNHLYANKSWVVRALKNPATSLAVNWTTYDAATNNSGFNVYTTATPGVGTFAGFGRRVYSALCNAAYDTGQLGALDVVSSTAPAVWMPPLILSTGMGAVTPAFGGTGTGQITQGVHYFYLLFTSKTGFTTRLGPVVDVANGTLIPFLTATSTVANDSLSISIAAPGGGWPTNIDFVELVATTSVNFGRRYIVPGSKFTITNTANPLTFTFSLADVTLATMPTATEYENLIYTGYLQSSSSDQPIKPYYCFQCGERLGLFFVDPTLGPAMAFSKPNQFEAFDLDRNVIYLPGLAKPIAGKWNQGSIYIFSEVGTFAYTDTGDDPVTWPKPRSIDAKVGTRVPYGATVDSTGFGFVADPTGLYAFAGGQYVQQPISYWQPDSWDSIDWSDIGFSMVDDKENWRLVICCKDLTGARRVFTWNYIEGYQPEATKYSEYTFSWSIQWAAIVKNYGDARSSALRNQLWLQSSSNRWTLARNARDSQPYRDVDGATVSGIDARLRLAFLPPQDRQWQVQEHHFELLRILGAGSWNVNIYGLDDVVVAHILDPSGAVQPITLSTGPAKELTLGYSLISEAASPEIVPATLTADMYFQISHWAHFFKGWSLRRGS